jgi:hypothetical protein
MTTIKCVYHDEVAKCSLEIAERTEGDRNQIIRARRGDEVVETAVPTADLLSALGVDPDWREKVEAAESCQLAADNMLRAESELTEAKASIDNWRQEAGIQSRRAEAAEAKLRASNQTLDRVVRERDELKRELGYAEMGADQWRTRADAAEAKLALVREVVEAGREEFVDVARISLLDAALADPEPFVLPTTVPARIEVRDGGRAPKVFYLMTSGAAGPNALVWINEDNWTEALNPDEIMREFDTHRLIGADE